MNYGVESYQGRGVFEKTESHSRTSEMDLKGLRNLVKKGEGLHLEFKLKANHPEKIVREIVAFANTDGGILLLGVGDDKSIPGLKFVDEEEYILVRAIEKYCDPPISYQLERLSITDTRDVLVFSIAKSIEKPHFVKLPNEDPKAYFRVEDRSVQASRELKQILRRENQEGVSFTYGDKERVLMQYLAEKKRISIDEFATLASIPKWLASRTLVLLVLSNVVKIKPEESVDWYCL